MTNTFIDSTPPHLSPFHQALLLSIIAGAVDLDLLQTPVERGFLFFRESEIGRTNVLFQPGQLGGAGDGHDPGAPDKIHARASWAMVQPFSAAWSLKKRGSS